MRLLARVQHFNHDEAAPAPVPKGGAMGNYDVSPPGAADDGLDVARNSRRRSDQWFAIEKQGHMVAIPRQAVGRRLPEVHDHAAKPIVVADPDLGRLGLFRLNPAWLGWRRLRPGARRRLGWRVPRLRWLLAGRCLLADLRRRPWLGPRLNRQGREQQYGRQAAHPSKLAGSLAMSDRPITGVGCCGPFSSGFTADSGWPSACHSGCVWRWQPKRTEIFVTLDPTSFSAAATLAIRWLMMS